MRKPFLFALAVAIAVFSAGCMSSSVLNQIQIGMTKAQIIGLLGTPSSTSAQANVEYLTYYLTADNGEGRDQPYLVRLVNGKVESFGRAFQLEDLYNRPVTAAQPGTPGFPTPATTVVTAPMAPQTGAATDLVGQLQQLKQLHDSGVLSDEEFQRAKAKLLQSQ